MNQKPIHQKQQGFSAWAILPWLLAIALAAVLWLVYDQLQSTRTSLETANAAQVEQQQVWQPKIAEAGNLPDAASPISSYQSAVKTAAQSVVNIYTTQDIRRQFADDPALQQYLERYYGDQLQQGNSLGSGVIVSKDGYIITNAHVIEGADEIVIVFNDGSKARASVVGRDVESDLAVIKVERNDLVPMAFRDTAIEVGDVALAIGNPFGVGQTVTQGIISATGRAGIGVSAFEEFIQTDAAINPGNSGGALVDANGALIGINTAIYSRSGGSMGIGFAIPTSTVAKVMNDLISKGYVSRGWIGIEFARSSDDPTALETPKGLTVARVFPDSPAAQAGLQSGDVLLQIDDIVLSNDASLVNLIAQKSPGTTVKATIKRNGQELMLDIVLAERPSLSAHNQSEPSDDKAQNPNDGSYEAQLQRLIDEVKRLQGQ
ncbi:trypsin-like peptidase domain-containing protein [Moraxella sp. FZFQ2102]|uniref:S1C family serine protease n=1 Tax=Moraxella sp. FZFQ2102 TaxID=2953752 RepID=UPI00209C189C|nr:trypsin-like peptidase domain-containing protein [Moraxella sp. FZFQ2102]USZ14798.1 trypsin-like peptidase domain-containing protein [Moraxella sp. FZFQ2102]